MFRGFKEEIRILGIDDCPFEKSESSTMLIGAVLRGKYSIDGLLSTNVRIDGLDAAQKIADMVNGSRHKDQLRVIMLNGMAVAGFNVVDIKTVSDKTGLPVIAITRNKPDRPKFLDALRRLPNAKTRISIIGRSGDIHRYGKIYFQASGITSEEAMKVISLSIYRGNIPEPLRVAHLIASGVKLGESHGRA